MKTSLDHLPHDNQQELRELTGMILAAVPETKMVILYGSYARGNYVTYDTRWEFGVRTEFRSDYDIEVVTKGIEYLTVSEKLREVSMSFDARRDRGYTGTPSQIIHDGLAHFRASLDDLRPFYTDMVKEGVLLYIHEHYPVPNARSIKELPPEKVLKLAEEYFEEKVGRGEGFMKMASVTEGKYQYQLGAFMLHQAAENLLHCTRLVFTLYAPKNHELDKIYNTAMKFSKRLRVVFPCDTEEEKDLFKLLCDAYVEGRYNPKFTVTPAEIDTLTGRVQLLMEITRRVCEDRIKFYKSKVIAVS